MLGITKWLYGAASVGHNQVAMGKQALGITKCLYGAASVGHNQVAIWSSKRWA